MYIYMCVCECVSVCECVCVQSPALFSRASYTTSFDGDAGNLAHAKGGLALGTLGSKE